MNGYVLCLGRVMRSEGEMNFWCWVVDPVSTLPWAMGEWVRVDGPNNETRHLAAMYGERVSVRSCGLRVVEPLKRPGNPG